MMTRSQLADELDLGASSPTTTYVVEVHSQAGPELLEEITGPGRVEATADAYLYTATVDDGMFWVDQIDERFWSFHTETVPARRGRSFFKAAVDSRRDLDWLWLPSAHLRHLWPGAVTRRVRASFNGSKMVHEDTSRDLRIQAAGRDADSVLTFLESSSEYRASVSFDSVQASVVDDDFGRVEEGVTRDGRFAVSGDSFELHLQFVRSVVQRYKQLVTLCEDRALDFTPFDTVAGDGGGTMSGAPIVVDFSRPIPDLDDFLSELLSSREPFRLWGRPIVSGDHAEVEAVDLHMGQRMRLELGREWMRVLLQPGACGNSVVRLVSNLQHTFDGALRFRDPQLDAALSRRPA